MSTQENKTMVRRFLEESLGEGKPELVDDLLDPDFLGSSYPECCISPALRARRLADSSARLV
jgi:hypothetical protein